MSLELGFRILLISQNPDSLSCIPDSTSKNLSDFAIRIPLHRVESSTVAVQLSEAGDNVLTKPHFKLLILLYSKNYESNTASAGQTVSLECCVMRILVIMETDNA